MNDRVYSVLFLSRRNSARSVFAEAILNRNGKGKFRAFSAAVEPADEFDPQAIELLESNGFPIPDSPPRHYREFAETGAADLDFVFTLSDTAAGEPLPTWPGLPVTAHWSSTDPILVEGEEWERKLAFGRVFAELERRLNIFMSLPFASLDRMSLQSRLDEIGRKPGGA